MMEKTLILKHISRMLCLLISYSKFTRTIVIVILTNRTFMEYHEYEIKMIDEIGINKVKIYEN